MNFVSAGDLRACMQRHVNPSEAGQQHGHACIARYTERAAREVPFVARCVTPAPKRYRWPTALARKTYGGQRPQSCARSPRAPQAVRRSLSPGWPTERESRLRARVAENSLRFFLRLLLLTLPEKAANEVASCRSERKLPSTRTPSIFFFFTGELVRHKW